MRLPFLIELDDKLAKYFRLILLNLHEKENLAFRHILTSQHSALWQDTFVHTHQTLHARSMHLLFFGLFYDSFTLSESEKEGEKEQAEKMKE